MLKMKIFFLKNPNSAFDFAPDVYHSWWTDHVTTAGLPQVYTPAPQPLRGQADAHLAFPVSSPPHALEW